MIELIRVPHTDLSCQLQLPGPERELVGLPSYIAGRDLRLHITGQGEVTVACGVANIGDIYKLGDDQILSLPEWADIPGNGIKPWAVVVYRLFPSPGATIESITLGMSAV